MIIPNDDFNALLSTIDYKAKGELLKEIAERNGTQDYYDEYFGQGNEDDEKLTSVWGNKIDYWEFFKAA